MDFLKGFGIVGSQPAEPPPSVLSEWNKYAAGDLETGAGPKPSAEPAPAATGSAFTSGIAHITFGFPGGSSGPATAAGASAIPSFRIPSGTDFIYFSAFVGGAFVFFFMAFFVFLPLLVLAPGKFALSFTFGSLCTMAAMNMLSGWKAGLEHMFSADRRLFTATYLGSMFATLYAAMYMRSYLLSLGFSVVQVLALAFYIISYFPGGAQGMQFMLSMVARGVSSCIGGLSRASG